MTRPDAVPACSSSSIPAAAHAAAPAALAPGQCRGLLEDLATITDPRHRRGRRHPLGAVLAVAVAAVLAGARSLAAIGEGPLTRPASSHPNPPVAAGGRGRRQDPARRRHPNPQVHLLAAMDHATGGILGQTDVDHTTNQIARFRPLLDRLDLTDTVVTADALHTHA
jgi:DDE_Tnp_1-associated